jgi:hypothetical protein
MRFINDPNCPKPLYDALVDSSKEYGEEVSAFLRGKRFDHHTSVSSLNTPTQKQVLLSRHANDIYVDPVRECWRSMLGNIIHFVLEKYAAKDPNYQTEVRLGCMFDVDGHQVLVHGKFDLYDILRRAIQDWKLTKAIYMAYPKTAYEMQLNVLHYLAVKNGYKVDILENVYLFSELDNRLIGKPDYPSLPYQRVQVKMLPLDEVHQFIVERIRKQLTEKAKPDKELTPCTDEERWMRTADWALYFRKKTLSKGEKKDADGKLPFSSRAVFHAPTKSELIAFRKSKGVLKGDVIYKEFKSEPKACEFCNARYVCRQYQNSLREREDQQQQLRELKP